MPSVSYGIRGHRSSVISDAAEDDRLMREIVKDLRKPPRLPSVSPEPHAPRQRMDLTARPPTLSW